MTDERKIELIAEILDVDTDEISPEMALDSFDWDLVAALSFIAMMDEEFNKAVKGADIKKLVTIQDALDLMEE